MSIPMILASVRTRGLSRVPGPRNGEPLTEYALRCMDVGALLAIQPIEATILAGAARLTNDAEDTLASLQDVVATVATSEDTDEGTDE